VALDEPTFCSALKEGRPVASRATTSPSITRLVRQRGECPDDASYLARHVQARLSYSEGVASTNLRTSHSIPVMAVPTTTA
jgi:hypothetical protein